MLEGDVNGESREVININGLMAVRIDAGDNTIRFDYVYTPLKQGIVCSIAGVLLFCRIYDIFLAKKKKTAAPIGGARLRGIIPGGTIA